MTTVASQTVIYPPEPPVSADYRQVNIESGSKDLGHIIGGYYLERIGTFVSCARRAAFAI